MLKYKMKLVPLKGGSFIMLAVVIGLLASPTFSAETWRLNEGGQWEAVSAKGEDKYILAVAEVKKLVNMGETSAVAQAIDKLKKNFPETAGPDLDAFIKAEMFFCEGKFTRAVKSYDKFLEEFPSSRLYEAALDRQFAVATAFLGGQKKRVLGAFKMSRYAEGIKIMERISDRAGSAPVAKRAAMAVAQSYEKREKYTEAYHKWSEVSSRWPTGQMGKESLLGMARCKHAAYKGPTFDVSSLISAKSYYENFKLRYPEDAGKINVDKTLNQIDEQLAYKEFITGEYYRKSGDKQSANLYYQRVLDNWPGSKATEMVKKAMKEERSGAKKEKKWKDNVTEKLEKLLL